jgi:hypothetical protein
MKKTPYLTTRLALRKEASGHTVFFLKSHPTTTNQPKTKDFYGMH